MPEYNEDQIKMALTAAKDLAAAKEARSQDSPLGQAQISESSEIQANRRRVENMLASFFTKAGFEVDKFDELLAQNQSALRRIGEERKAEAVKRSASRKETLHYAVKTRQKAIEHLVDITPPESPAGATAEFYELLDLPYSIWPTPGLFFDAHYEPVNTWGKIQLDSAKANGYEELSFYFPWANPRDAYAVIDVDAYLVLNGYCQVYSGGGMLPGDRRSRLSVIPRLKLWENTLTLVPPSALELVDENQNGVYLQVDTGGLWESGVVEKEEVYRGYDLRRTLFLVPPRQPVVVEVGLQITYETTETDIGRVFHVDFASGDFEVLCPGVLIKIVS
jgi:hypothetical protein